jgi:hypothetical protein
MPLYRAMALLNAIKLALPMLKNTKFSLRFCTGPARQNDGRLLMGHFRDLSSKSKFWLPAGLQKGMHRIYHSVRHL